ncbi:MAG: phosphoenolpyruvate carboxykinase [Calditrichia bacterium]|nr:phosphoenolpyruvate carboxykinase [Calditrichia bacterium]
MTEPLAHRDAGHAQGPVGLDYLGIKNINNAYWNLTTPALYEQIIRRREGVIGHLGPVILPTGAFTGRSPNDKFIVKEPSSEAHISWGDVNVPFSEENFNKVYMRVLAYLQGSDIFIQDCYAGADPKYRIAVRVITEYAWHNLFARNMFLRLKSLEEYKSFKPEFTIINLPKFHAVPELDGTRSEAFVLVNYAKKLVLIGGTSYAGEIKKSVFSILNYILPHKKVLSMHCSANQGKNGDVALFFGLSGTGKTTLSADPEKALIGDDEHGWSEDGIFNFEGGCYAKVIRLSEEAEPDIYQTTRKFGTILENVVFDTHWRRPDLDDDTFTENTRAAYPITHIDNIIPEGVGGHPKNIVFLTADAFGVLPPISKLTRAQAMYHFLSGYTAKIAGTERGITEPQATFSTCFGAPFMPLNPNVYAEILGEKIEKHKVNIWLVNTGWTGGPYGIGERMSIKYTRALLHAALDGKFDNVSYEKDPVFDLEYPTECEGVPSEILNPRNTWKDKNAYDIQAKKLAKLFIDNFKTYENDVADDVKNVGPV